MAFSTTELSQIKYFLDYGNLTMLARPYFDVALIFEDIIKNFTDTWGEGFVRSTILPNLSSLETSIMAASVLTVATKVDEVTRNPAHLDELIAHRQFWVGRLESLLKLKQNIEGRTASGSSIEQG